MTLIDVFGRCLGIRPKLAAQPGSAIWHIRGDSLAMISLVALVAVALLAIAAPLVAPFPDQGMGVTHIEQKLQPPSWQFLLGTDSLGRDILSRVLFGARTALISGIAIVAIGAVAGTILGAAAGYFGGWIDEAIMRVTDVFLAFPPLLLAMTVAVVLEPSLTNAIIAISLTWWPWYTRIARGQAVSIRERKYVKTGHWWVPTFPGLALFLIIMAANLLGDAVQAATNPRTRRAVS
jgi:peptide/nickel transport system permease protein